MLIRFLVSDEISFERQKKIETPMKFHISGKKKKKEDLYMHICTSALYSIGADICATDCELDQFVNGCVCQAESWGKKKQTSSEVQPQPQPPMQCA